MAKCKAVHPPLSISNFHFSLQQITDDISGVFDFYWCSKDILAVALAEGLPLFYKFSIDTMRLEAVAVSSGTTFDMTLSITGRLDNLITCDNRGRLRLSQVQGSELQVTDEWTGHDSEIWYVASDRHDSNLFYSCADEGSLKAWDGRCGNSPIFAERKAHEAGVCCAASNPHEEFILATGSYDENVRIWDRRRMKQPLRVINCGSGAWRVVWNEEREGEFGVAAMRKGFFIYNAQGDVPIASLEMPEEAVAYGIDVKGSAVVSCSFYNNQAQIWRK